MPFELTICNSDARRRSIAARGHHRCVRGEIVQISMPKTPREMDIVALTFRELTLKGVRVYDPHDFERAIALATRWSCDLSRLASEPYPLDRAEEAFAVARQGDKALKVFFDVK